MLIFGNGIELNRYMEGCFERLCCLFFFSTRTVRKRLQRAISALTKVFPDGFNWQSLMNRLAI